MNHARGQLTGNSSNSSTVSTENTVHFHSGKQDKITLQYNRAEIQQQQSSKFQSMDLH